MAETFYDRVNDYSSVKITLASPNDIRSWSFGEVKKPETINYRTYRPEKDGLFCERIFGPERDYECACGKYKGTKFKGIICDRCGVKVTHSRVRRKRMGHINLAAPIVHIWFFKSTPSRLGNLLGMKTSDMEKIVYFQDYVVIDPGDTPGLKHKQVLTEDEYRQLVDKHGQTFTANMGAEAVKELLARLDLDKLNDELRAELKETRSKQKIKDLSKRLKIVEQIRHSENKAEWMVMDVIPVIPPDLRPLVLLESGNFATSDLNDLYRRIINRNNRLKKLMDLNAPEVIIRNEKRMLQQSVDALFDNGRCRRPVLGSSNRPLKSLTDMIKGKQGRFRENLLGKRVDYSARSVIVVGPELKLHQCGLPKKIALELFQPFIIRKLKEHGLADTIKSAKKMLERRDPEVWDILEEVIYQHPVMLNRAPTLHRMGIQAFEPVLVEGNAIKIHPLVCVGFNADFDGDQMAVHLPLSIEAQTEVSVLMIATHNIFSPSNGNPIISPAQDIVYGVYYITSMPEAPAEQLARELVNRSGELPPATVKAMQQFRCFKDPVEALLAYDLKKLAIHEPIVVKLPEGQYVDMVLDQKASPVPAPPSRRILTTIGRLIFNEMLEHGLPYYNCVLGKKGLARVIDDTYARSGRAATIDLLDLLKETGFKRATLAGLSFGIADLRIPVKKQEIIAETQKKVDRVERAYEAGAITELERYNQLLDLWTHCREEVTRAVVKELENDRRDADGNPLPVDLTPKQSVLDGLNKTSLPNGFPGIDSLTACRESHSSVIADAGSYRDFCRAVPKMKEELRKVVSQALNTAGTWSAREANRVREPYFTGSVINQGFEVTWYETKDGDRKSLEALESKLLSIFADNEWESPFPRLNRNKGNNSEYTGSELASVLEHIGHAQWVRISNISDSSVFDSAKKKSGLYFLRPVGGCLQQGYIGKAEVTNAKEPNDLFVRIRQHLHTGDWSSKVGTDQSFMESIVVDWEMRAREIAFKQKGKFYLNPAYLEVVSGARGSIGQLQQLAGMRGLMSKPSGEIMETPIRANAREGMSVLEYFSSTHGARKGLADTALKTADSGYLTRKLADVAQNVVVTSDDCGTKQGVTKRAIYKGEEIDVPLREAIIGRTARETIRNPITDELIVAENDMVSEEAALKIESLGIDSVMVRSPLTCESERGVCAKCYGQDMSTGRLVELGLAVGIMGAQSIGEPGTQLTMRTFHTGGSAVRTLVETEYRSSHAGTIEIRDAAQVPVKDDEGNSVLVSLKRSGEIAILDPKGRELEKYKLQYGAYILVKPGETVKKGQILVKWDPHRTPILAEKTGTVRFEDIKLGETVRPESESTPIKGKKGATTTQTSLVVIEHKGEMHPRIVIEDSDGKIQDFHYLPAKARIEVQEGQKIEAGHMLARQPREVASSADIVGGLPRVTEVFEARKPRDAAVMAEISGTVELRSDKRRGKMTIIVRSGSEDQGGLEKEHHVPQDRHLLVHSGDYVTAGDPLIEGPLVPHDILRIKGEEALFNYLLDEVQNVYRAVGQAINDKHIEIILSQMLRKVRVEDPGDADLLPNEVVDKIRFRLANARLDQMARIKDAGDTSLPVGALVTRQDIRDANAKAEADGKQGAKATRPKPAKAKTLLLGITKASLQSESFLSGASFQETTKVLTEAALAGRVDDLKGLKENVLLGHLIPAGTGFKPYTKIKVLKLAEPVAQEAPSRQDELADAASKAEAAGAMRREEIKTTVGESRLVAELLGEIEATPEAGTLGKE